jgi:plasmid stabilization system protein ParE
MADRSFEYHPDAIAEAAEAYRWYAERSEEAAEKFWVELRRARELVTRRPQMRAKYLHGARCFRLQQFPYGLIYIERGDRIIGLAVAHLRRRPGYWRRRLEA